MMYGHEKSRSAIVAGKPTNNAEQSAAEPVEPRAETEGNVGRQSTHRAQYRASVSQALACIRQPFAGRTRGGNRMRESCKYGSVRGAPSNGRSYRDRREFITLLGCAVATWPLGARAQQAGRPRRIGVLINLSESDLEAKRLTTAFQEGLAQLAWTDGRNVRIDFRWAGGDVGRIRTFAKELVELSPDIVVGYGTPVVVALQQQTRSIPIVFLSVTDPVGQGLVASLAHPGGNITGFAVFEISLGAKWMEALKQIAPDLKRVTTIYNPRRSEEHTSELQSLRHLVCRLLL